jgi:hypothetical protein
MSKYISLDVDTEVEFYVRDILEKINDDELRGEVIRRKLSARINLGTTTVENYKPGEFRRILCDVLSLGYQVSDDEILGRIKGCL